MKPLASGPGAATDRRADCVSGGTCNSTTGGQPPGSEGRVRQQSFPAHSETVPLEGVRGYERVKMEPPSVLVLSENPSSSMPRDRRMLKYMFDIRVSPSRQ